MASQRMHRANVQKLAGQLRWVFVLLLVSLVLLVISSVLNQGLVQLVAFIATLGFFGYLIYIALPLLRA